MASRRLGGWSWQAQVNETRRRQRDQEELREAWVNFLGQWEWDWFCTLTFRKDVVHPEAAEKTSRVWISKINRQLFGGRWYKKEKGVFWVRALEMQRRNVLHYHMLIRGAGVKELRRLYWMDEWEKLAGYARIERPRDAGVVNRYCSKYVVKGGEIDIGGPIITPLPSLFGVQSGSAQS